MLLIGVFLNYLIPNAAQVFTLVTSIATICFIWVWSMIVIAHLRYRRLKPENAAANTFRMPGAPVVNWILLAFFVFVLVLLGFASDTRTALFITPGWFLLLAVAYGLVKRHKMKKN
jgi:D-serine/D-alanine/glycine transporter